jgi:phage-related protein
MKAILALIFFTCVASSMAVDNRPELLQNLVQQGQTVIQSVLVQLQAQLIQLIQQGVSQLSNLVGSIGGRLTVDWDGALQQVKPIVGGLINQVLVQLLGSVSGLIGGPFRFRTPTCRDDCCI